MCAARSSIHGAVPEHPEIGEGDRSGHARGPRSRLQVAKPSQHGQGRRRNATWSPSRGAGDERVSCSSGGRRDRDLQGAKSCAADPRHRLGARQPDGRPEPDGQSWDWERAGRRGRTSTCARRQAFMLEKGTGTVFPAAVSAAAPNSPTPSSIQMP